MSRSILGAAVVSCVACAGPLRTEAPPSVLPPSAAHGFPAQKLDGLVFASARFDEHYDEAFGLDLARAADVLPIAVTVALRGPGQDEARAWLNPERFAPELVLADGTTLAALPPRVVAKRVAERYGERVESKGLATGLLSPRGTSGWLYFDLGSHTDLELDGATIEHSAGGRTRALAIDESLVTFAITLDDREQDFCVGVGR
ncbi:MAG: hypothetical protein L6Q99_18845 [Planctomycetes bacterium]|nr:hypothetical protein [Planctomycetota bacterium]